MYAVLVTCNALAPPNVGIPATRGSSLFGLRFVAIPAQGETVQQAYQGLSITTRQITNDPAAGSVGQGGAPPYFTDQIPVVDDSMMMMCRAEAIQVNGPTGQEVLVYIPEGQAEVIYPGAYGAINGGGGNNPGAVATTTQVTATGYTPTTSADGASISGAKGAFVWAVPNAGGTWVDGEPFNVWRGLLGGTVWIRCPGNDIPVPTGSGALGVTKAIGLPDFTFAAGPNERWAVIAAASAIVGAAAVGTTYEVQS